MEMKLLKELKIGELFRLTENSKKTYVKGFYDRSIKEYDCFNYDDISEFRRFDGNKLVYAGFKF